MKLHWTERGKVKSLVGTAAIGNPTREQLARESVVTTDQVLSSLGYRVLPSWSGRSSSPHMTHFRRSGGKGRGYCPDKS